MGTRVVASAAVVLAFLASATPASAHENASEVRVVELRDRCDPASFDAAIGEGTCIPHEDADVTFAEFLTQLNPVDFGHDGWRMNPDDTEITVGDSLRAVVRGGEFHTFTEVTAFGPGCISLINGRLGLTGPPPRPCDDTLFATTGVAPGGSLTVSGLAPGTHLFMCFIHPWMRSEIDVRQR